MKITRTIGEYIGIGDKLYYYPQAEASGQEFNVVVMRPDSWPHAAVGEKAVKEADDCERFLRKLLAAPELLHALRQCLSDLEWAEKQDERTNFKSSILLARAAISRATEEGTHCEHCGNGPCPVCGGEVE